MSGVTVRWVMIVALAGALGLSGCTSTSGDGSGRANSSGGAGVTSGAPGSSAAAPTSAAAPSTPSTTAGSHSSVPAEPQGCAAKQLTVSGGPLPGGSAAGHTGVLLLFTNTSARACTLFGYPGVDGLTPGGKDIASATRTLNGYLGGCGCKSLHSVTLSPGGKASAIAEGSIGSSNCDRFGSLLVTPPNTSASTEIKMAPHSCQFTIHPVVKGSTGSG